MTAPAIDQSQVPPPSSGPTKTEIAATLIAAYIAATVALRARVKLMTNAWFGAEGYRTQGAESFINAMVPTLDIAQQTMADLTSAYLTQQITTLGGGTTAAVGIPSSLVTGSAIRGVDPAEVLRRPYEQLWTALSQGKSLDQAIQVGRVRAESISMTNLQLAKTVAGRAVMSRDHRVLGYRRVLTGARSCGLCIIASSQRYHKADLMPIHPSCVPFGSRVRVNNILNATRRWYEGKLVVFTCASGDQIAVTPEHPVLTGNGWTAAHRVRDTDYLFYDDMSVKRVVGRSPQEDKMPTFVEDVWRSLTMTFDLTRVPLAAEDFHGNGSDSEVDVVRADGYFSSVGHQCIGQGIDESLLMSRWSRRSKLTSLGSAATLIPTSFTSTSDAVCGEGLSSAFFSGHLCRSHEAGLRGAASFNFGFSEPSFDGVSTDTLLMSDRLLSEAPIDVVGTKLLDRVVDVSHVDFAHYVFNFQTMSGTYGLNNHIIHNCDCAIAPIVGTHDPGRSINSVTLTQGALMTGKTESGVPVYGHDGVIELGDLVGPVHDAIQERFGQHASDARTIDYRKVLITHQHGEYGPTLAVASHSFTDKQITSGDLSAPSRRPKGVAVTQQVDQPHELPA